MKVRRYGGGESVISLHRSKDGADRAARVLNRDYQSDNYYVEEWKEATDD